MPTALPALAAVGRAGLVTGRIAAALPRMNGRELLRALVHFGFDSLPLAFAVAAVVGTVGVLQTSLYVQRFGARDFLGWAGGYAILWEFGPLILGLLLAARVGARNASELATLSVGGQLEGLAGVALDPYPLLLAPRLAAIVLSAVCLSAVTFFAAIAFEVLTAAAVLAIPGGAFAQSLSGMLSVKDFAAGIVKLAAFALATGIVSCTAGVSARGGARGVGRAAAAAVVHAAGLIFLLDFALTPLIDRVLG